MLRVVIDTSSLVSYILTHGKLMRQVIAHWRMDTFTMLSSPATRAELAHVLARPVIQNLAVVPPDELARGLELFSENVHGALHLSGVCRDPKDDKFVACAVEGRAHYIVSSDHDLLDMRYYGDVAIVNPGQFLVAVDLYPLDAKALATSRDPVVLAGIQGAIPLEPGTAAQVAAALKILRGE